MGILRVEGVVLGSFKLGEADKIITLYSRERGKIQGVAKGARRFKNRFGSTLEPLTQGTFHLFEKEGRSLHRLDRVDLLCSFQNLREDFRTLTCAAYFIDLLKHFTPLEQAHAQVFELTLAVLKSLAHPSPNGSPSFLRRTPVLSSVPATVPTTETSPVVTGSRESGGSPLPATPPAFSNDGLSRQQHGLLVYYHFHLLRLSGYQPQLEKCVRCHGIQPPGWVVFSFSHGGIVCAPCNRQDGGGIRFSGAAQAFLRQTLSLSPDRLGRYVLSDGLLQEIHRFLEDYTQFLLGKQAPSFRRLLAWSNTGVAT